MTIASNLQCPHCSSPIHLTQATLVGSDAAILCDHCQREVVVDASSLVCNDSISANNTANQPQTADDTSTDSMLYSDMLIHDDMDIDDAIDLNAIAEYDSLEGMNAWVKKLETMPSIPINVPSDNNTSHDYLTNSHQSSNHEISRNSAPITHTAISSVDANDIRASIATDTSDPIHENAWLERLLQEQNATEYPAVNDHEDTELTEQLADMGVPTIHTQANNQARANKIQTRMQASKATSAHHNAPAIATLLWTIASGLLILLLFTQYIIFNIDNLAKNPAVASYLQAVCSVLPCTIPTADINAFIIIKPTFKASQFKNARIFSDIQAQLVNKDDQTQLLPNLKVSIYNQDTIIGEFIAQPADYLLSSETKLAAERRKSVMFTVPITANKISKVIIEPFY